MDPWFEARAQLYLELAWDFLPPPDDRSLSGAYTRLFVGPGAPLANPHGSVYLEGQLMGRSTEDAQRCYREAGLQPRTDRGELPDHIAVELAFVAYLLEQEGVRPESVARWRERRLDFLRQHLLRWMPDFCALVRRADAHPYYTRLVNRLEKVVREDLARLEPVLARNLAEVGERGHALSQGASRMVGKRARFPNMRLRVDRSRCTLCTRCAENCPEDALTASCTATTIALTFDPALCHGCRACLRACPEAALDVERRPPQSTPPRSRRRRLISARRVICPQCRRPHIAEPWLARLLARLGDTPATRASLTRCPVCKALAMDTRPIPAGRATESINHV